MDKYFFTERRSGIEFKRTNDFRMPYERDRARIIHSAAFRRLQAKTQILGIGGGDFHRTRLTHSMEVSQISRGLVYFFLNNKNLQESEKNILPPVELIEAVSLSHDIGHPPFGHGGESVLNFFMKDFGGFEANGQTLRLLSKLEAHTENYGLDLTRRLLLGVLKYPVKYSKVKAKKYPELPNNIDEFNPNDYAPPKSYMDCDQDVVGWILKNFSDYDVEEFTSFIGSNNLYEHSKSIHKSFDTTIMDIADDIAYGTHDLEDGITLNMISKDDWVEGISGKLDKLFEKKFELTDLTNKLFDKTINKSHKRKYVIGAIVHSLICSAKITKKNQFESDILDYKVELSDEANVFLEALKDITTKHMIDLHTVKTFEYRGQHILRSLINAFSANPVKLLTPQYAELYKKVEYEGDKKRIICDYVAGMTDEYAIRMYERLFVPRHGNVFERL